jgi:hypothetical protein
MFLSPKNRISLVCVIALLSTGCALLGHRFSFSSKAGQYAASRGFSRTVIKTSKFALLSFYRFNGKEGPLRVYIEGDGMAWLGKNELSRDPTPRRAIVLDLAAQDNAQLVAYLARPGQYVMDDGFDCAEEYWAGKRFSEEVISSMNEAVSELKGMSGGKSIVLIGYSGGGAVAVLIAARRNDVSGLITVAGNLDHDAVNAHNNVDRLCGSLNAIDSAQKVKGISQRHFAGSDDNVVPPDVALSFADRMGDRGHRTITVVAGAAHHEKWKDKWSCLLKEPLVKGE